MKKNKNEICINLWDDYPEEESLSEGEVQLTAAYVESDIDHNSCKNILSVLAKKVADLGYCADGVETELVFCDMTEKLPEMVGTDMEFLLFKRWELEFKHLTHEKRERLIEQLSDWVEQGVRVHLYSES